MESVVSLFSGCGGFDLGFKEQGFDVVYSCDIDPAAVDCYARNVDTRVFVRDVTSNEFHSDIASIGQCDIVLGGFPCQGFSKAGPKRTNDERNTLYVEMKNAIATLRPRLFIAENVDGISQNFSGFYLKRIIEDFKRIGYQVEYRIVDAVSYGLPQHRRRIFFVGTRQSSGYSFQWPSPTHQIKIRNGEFKIPQQSVSDEFSLWENPKSSYCELKRVLTIRDAIEDLVQLDKRIPDHDVTYVWPEKYEAVFRIIRPGQKLCNVRHSITSVHTWEIPEVFGHVTERERVILETIARHRRHRQYGDIPNGNPLPLDEIEHLSGIHGIQAEVDQLLSKGYLKMSESKYDLKGAMFCSGLFKRPNWDEPSPTVLTNFHNPRYFLHPTQNRPFSLRECARLQGFSDSFVFTNSNSVADLVTSYRLVGNAVPPPLSRVFASAALQFFTQNQFQAVAL